MNKTELVAAMADQAELSKKDAEKALKAFVDVITDELKAGGKVQLVGFGSFEVADRAARNGVNPLTGKPMNVPACKAPKFKAGKALKCALARFFRTVKTSSCLVYCHLIRVAKCYFIKVFITNVRVLYRHRAFFHIHITFSHLLCLLF